MRFAALPIALLLVTGALAAGEEPPLPPPRPAGIGDEKSSSPSVPGPSPGMSGGNYEEASERRAACLRRLADAGATAEPAPAVANGSCGAATPLKLTGLPGGIAVAPAATVTCEVAEALAAWAAEGVTVEAKRHLAETPTKILIGTSYECRSQNRQAGAKLSEHAFAKAVDVMGFAFPKRPAFAIAAREDESPESLFQAAVRQSACAHFNTVLGPGSDAAHANHLHLDMRDRKRGAKLCQ